MAAALLPPRTLKITLDAVMPDKTILADPDKEKAREMLKTKVVPGLVPTRVNVPSSAGSSRCSCRRVRCR